MGRARTRAAQAVGLLAALGLAAVSAGTAPQPAEPMPRAAQALLNDVTHTGEAYIAVGDRGHVLRSEDGRDWRQVPAPVRRMLTRVRFADAQRGWAVGYDRTILQTGNGGALWQLRHHDGEDGQPVFDVLFDSEGRTGLAVGANGFLKRSDDGGASWTPVDAGFLDLGVHLFGIARLADGTLLVCGERGLLARSDDAGRTWALLESPYAGSWFGLLPYGERGALLYGMRGNVFVTEAVHALPETDPEAWEGRDGAVMTDADAQTRGGWRHLQNPEMQSFFGATQLPDGRYLLVGVNGVIARLDARALELQLLPRVDDAPLGGVASAGNTILLTGRSGVLRLDQESVP